MDCPSPVPAAIKARVPPGSGLPGLSTQKSSGGRCSRLWPVAPRSFMRTTLGTFSSLRRFSVSTIQGRFVALTRPLMTGPAMPKPAATIRSPSRCSVACRENSLTIRSNRANSLLAKRFLKTGVSVPRFSEKSARLHFVPPTSPARITCSPRLVANRLLCQVLPLVVAPMPAVAFEEQIGFPRSPTPRSILRHRGGPGRAPHIEDGVHKRPGCLDAVAAIEQRRIAAQTIVYERRISAARGLAETFAIAEIHGDVPDAHFRSRPLGSKGHCDPFIGLDVKYDAVGFNFALAKNDVRRAPELDYDLRGALGQTFAGSQVERNTRPAPVVDQQPAGDKGLRLGSWIYAWFLPVAGNRLVPEFPRRVLPANHRLRHHFQIERADGLQHLQFFVAHRVGIKRGGRFHGDQRSELQDVALDHVAKRAGGFIKTAPPLDTQRFRRRDLNVVDVIPVPERLENAVAKPKNEKVLHGILAQVVVDAVDLLFLENVQDDLIQFLRRREVSAERLFDDDVHPGVRRGGPCKSGAAELFDDIRINLGRRGEVEEPIAAQILGSFHVAEALGKLRVGFLVGVIPLVVEQAAGEFAPQFWIDRADFRNAFCRVAGHGPEAFIGHRRARKTHEGIARSEERRVGKE